MKKLLFILLFLSGCYPPNYMYSPYYQPYYPRHDSQQPVVINNIINNTGGYQQPAYSQPTYKPPAYQPPKRTTTIRRNYWSVPKEGESWGE
jgi:hypothetical protein